MSPIPGGHEMDREILKEFAEALRLLAEALRLPVENGVRTKIQDGREIA